MNHHFTPCLAVFLVSMSLLAAPAVAQTPAPTGAQAASSTAAAPAKETAAPATKAAGTFDPTIETRKYLDRLKGEARSRSDSYFEGKTWMTLWETLYGLAVAWLLLSKRLSARLRERAERFSSRPNVQTAFYALLYVPLVALLTLPWAVYSGFWREHQYGLSNLSFAGWIADWGKELLVEIVLALIAFTGLYAILRRAPRTWWAWGTIAGAVFLTLMVMVSPVFISPLFNTYQPLPDGALRNDILSMARANGIPADNVYWFDASKQTKRISANVSGMFGTTRISLNDNLLNRTSPAEIKAVMGHEMGHYVLNHGPKHVVSFALILLGGLLFIRFGWSWAHARFGQRFGVRGIEDPAGLPLLGALFSVYMLFAMPALNTVIRTAEVEADIFGLNAAREPEGFAEAIYKLSEYRKMEPGTIEEVLFFDHPSGYNRIYSAMRWRAENPR